jgi:hypothetical protein
MRAPNPRGAAHRPRRRGEAGSTAAFTHFARGSTQKRSRCSNEKQMRRSWVRRSFVSSRLRGRRDGRRRRTAATRGREQFARRCHVRRLRHIRRLCWQFRRLRRDRRLCWWFRRLDRSSARVQRRGCARSRRAAAASGRVADARSELARGRFRRWRLDPTRLVRFIGRIRRGWIGRLRWQRGTGASAKRKHGRSHEQRPRLADSEIAATRRDITVRAAAIAAVA